MEHHEINSVLRAYSQTNITPPASPVNQDGLSICIPQQQQKQMSGFSGNVGNRRLSLQPNSSVGMDFKRRPSFITEKPPQYLMTPPHNISPLASTIDEILYDTPAQQPYLQLNSADSQLGSPISYPQFPDTPQSHPASVFSSSFESSRRDSLQSLTSLTDAFSLNDRRASLSYYPIQEGIPALVNHERRPSNHAQYPSFVDSSPTGEQPKSTSSLLSFPIVEQQTPTSGPISVDVNVSNLEQRRDSLSAYQMKPEGASVITPTTPSYPINNTASVTDHHARRASITGFFPISGSDPLVALLEDTPLSIQDTARRGSLQINPENNFNTASIVPFPTSNPTVDPPVAPRKGRRKSASAVGEKKERAFDCHICGRSFGRKFNMMQHVKTHEVTRVKDQECEVCGQKFYRIADLNRHRKTHTDRGQFISPCGKVFSRQDAIERHIRRTKCIVCRTVGVAAVAAAVN